MMEACIYDTPRAWYNAIDGIDDLNYTQSVIGMGTEAAAPKINDAANERTTPAEMSGDTAF
jgi:hypothetical protein